MIYDYTITTGTGEELHLSDFKGKVIMVVNTATGCGFTPQYAPIEQMYKDYHNQGLEILDIPCNQFGGQAPGTEFFTSFLVCAAKALRFPSIVRYTQPRQRPTVSL